MNYFKISIAFTILINLISCNTAPTTTINTNTDLSTALGFVKSMYDGDFTAAECVTLQSNDSKACFQKFVFSYKQLTSKADKENYKNASIIFAPKEVVNDSFVIYRINDPLHKSTPPPIAVVKKGATWLVDYAYSCSGNL